MQRRKRWTVTGVAVAGALLLGAIGASAQTAPTPGTPRAGLCPAHGLVGGGFGPAGPAALGTSGPAAVHEAIASALGVTSQELWDARAAGKTAAELAAEKNVPPHTVVDAALAAHTAQLDAAVKAGTLTQAQADAINQVMGGFGFGPGRRGAP
ncbi:MAG TPA: hypothetical protein VF937_17790 [Chloroflexota bacterium]